MKLGRLDPKPARLAIVALVLLCGAAAAWFGGRRVFAAAPPRPNVILISLDTLRADRLGCYGYPKPTTPELDHFARRATRFEHASTPQGFTLTAHASLATSLYPSVHGVSDTTALPRQAPKLAERLAEAGYRTFGIVDAVPWLSPKFGFERGFDTYEQIEGGARGKITRATQVTGARSERPFYLMLHLFDAHSDMDKTPYESDPEDAATFTSWYQGPYRGCSPSNQCGTQHLIEIQTKGTLPPPEVRQLISDQYDAGVRSMDRALGELFRALEEQGRFEDSIIVVTADHGELLFEHDTVLHGHLWEETLRVPLLVHLPGQTTKRVSDALVSLVDIAPTILELLELPPMKPSQGTSFVGPLHADHAFLRPYVEISIDDRVFGVRSQRWKLFGMHEFHLYDLFADPKESRNLWRDDMIEGPAREMRAALKERRAEAARLREEVGPPLAIEAATKAVRERLKGLGYAGDDDPGH